MPYAVNYASRSVFYYKDGFYGISDQLTQLEDALEESTISPVLMDSVPQLQIEPQTLTKHHGH